eukprot:CAMPEP_0177667792 /NCGR_PEP_ID=MMETSP0447-20121125/22332_1 /TAXON_ID=0 /ORGANISM="Stygamoeba regulata, Strain BSH-02190019" /LENGTH=78 /DNA_ID=CAMNT_0019174087 /DNA_START=44 /DNA_END=276 /DNA_ORIENTATION=-
MPAHPCVSRAALLPARARARPWPSSIPTGGFGGPHPFSVPPSQKLPAATRGSGWRAAQGSAGRVRVAGAATKLLTRAL